MKLSRRNFLESSAAAVAIAGSGKGRGIEMGQGDGPAAKGFKPLPLAGNANFDGLSEFKVSEKMLDAAADAPRGVSSFWGIPFRIGRPLVLRGETASEEFDGIKAEWLVFLHTTDAEEAETDGYGFPKSKRGEGRLAEHVADYVVVFSDGAEERQAIKRRHHVGMFQRHWGENCFQSVPHLKPHSIQPIHERVRQGEGAAEWGEGETRTTTADLGSWVNWLWAWRNPCPEKEIVALRFEPKAGTTVLSAVSAGSASSHPLRWGPRRKAILKLPGGVKFDPRLGENGLLKQVQLDLGQVISAEEATRYPNANWEQTYNNQVPELLEDQLLVEYSAHPDACFVLADGSRIAVSDLIAQQGAPSMVAVASADQKVSIRVLDRTSGKPVAVKLHLHGEAGEYLAPADRHRRPNSSWFEDYCAEFQHLGRHRCVYIPGETTVKLPKGRVYLEVSKGFEIKPVRRVLEIEASTESIEIQLEKVLPWRERGWVTADTHVHFLSPQTAGLEGAAEGVNVVNLLASQWGELMTNVGDFDGKTTFGSKEAGGDGEWLVRVGTENRQHVLGHISLLGYRGGIIAPMCTGGPEEAAIGDPIETLLMEWAELCRQRGGLVVLPHFPNPRCENAADIVTGSIDAIEMTSWGNLYAGIDPYSLADYYRYLNCGYFVAAVGGTDKMSASTAVGTVRTYAKLPSNQEFTYQAWKDVVRAGNTFVTYGPLLEFRVDGNPAGSRILMNSTGGTVEVDWSLASVTVPMTRVELVVNGEIRESQAVDSREDSGHWSVGVGQSCWMALLIRGHYGDKPEMIAAHSSPVMIRVEGSDLFSVPDGLVTLEQIEGSLAYLDTVGTRADDEAYKRMRMRLTSAYRNLHNELHQRGEFHEHSPFTDHEEHHS